MTNAFSAAWRVFLCLSSCSFNCCSCTSNLCIKSSRAILQSSNAFNFPAINRQFKYQNIAFSFLQLLIYLYTLIHNIILVQKKKIESTRESILR